MTKLEAIEEISLQCITCLGKGDKEYCNDYCEYKIAMDCIQHCIDEENDGGLIMNQITKEELNKELLEWAPKLIFTALADKDNNIQLILNVDAYNKDMNWAVNWFDKYDGLKHSVEFTEFAEARDYFLEKIQ